MSAESDNGRAKYNKTDTDGQQYVNGLVQKDTYDFLKDYKGLYSYGSGLDRLVEEVKRLRTELQQLRDATTSIQNLATRSKVQ